MRNPVRNEESAFRFLVGLIGYFVLIVVGAKIDRWLGLAVFLLLTGAAGWWFSRPAPKSDDDTNVLFTPDVLSPADVPSVESGSLAASSSLAPVDPLGEEHSVKAETAPDAATSVAADADPSH